MYSLFTRRLLIIGLIAVAVLFWHSYNEYYPLIKAGILESSIGQWSIQQIGLTYSKKLLIGPIMLIGAVINMSIANLLAYLLLHQSNQLLISTTKISVYAILSGFTVMLIAYVAGNHFAYEMAYYFTHGIVSPLGIIAVVIITKVYINLNKGE